MARVSFEGTIAELDNVAVDSYKNPTLFRLCVVRSESRADDCARSAP